MNNIKTQEYAKTSREFHALHFLKTENYKHIKSYFNRTAKKTICSAQTYI